MSCNFYLTRAEIACRCRRKPRSEPAGKVWFDYSKTRERLVQHRDWPVRFGLFSPHKYLFY